MKLTSVPPPGSGIVVLCDRQGIIEKVVHDGLGLTSRLAVGQPFAATIGVHGGHPLEREVELAERFMETLRDSGYAFGWEIQVPVQGNLMVLNFIGGATNDGVLIVGKVAHSGGSRLIEELMRINNETLNDLRATVKQAALSSQARIANDDQLLAELSLANNEVITAQRELAKKNAIFSQTIAALEQALSILNALEGTRAAGGHQAAHDLRSGFSTVELASALLNDQGLGEPDRLQTTALLRKSVSFLHDMLNNLVDVSRLSAGHEQRKLAPFDAAHLLSDFCATMQSVAGSKGLYLKCDGPESLLVEGDGGKVHRILQNLVLNALKYTEHGGITVSWESCKENDADRWAISVQDTGPGIRGNLGLPVANQSTPAPHDAHDLDSKVSTKRISSNQNESVKLQVSQSHHPLHQQAGEGIGLSIVKGLCDLLDATLELETHTGQGSTFRVSFPVNYQNSR